MDIQHGEVGTRGRVGQCFRIELLIVFDGTNSRGPILRLAKSLLRVVALNQCAECETAGFLTLTVCLQSTSVCWLQHLGSGLELLSRTEDHALAEDFPLGGSLRASDKPRLLDHGTVGLPPRSHIDNVLASLIRVLSVSGFTYAQSTYALARAFYGVEQQLTLTASFRHLRCYFLTGDKNAWPQRRCDKVHNFAVIVELIDQKIGVLAGFQ
jgi:hypothetical protein